jgi:ribosome-associated protein
MARPDEPRAPDPTQEPPSKTRRKAQMHALQDLGEALVDLEPQRLSELDLPDRLVEAVTEARRIKAHEGRRRQMQLIGKLMRDIDPAPVREALARCASGAASDQVVLSRVERWRESMLRDDAALDRFMAEHATVDRDALASLVADARAERARGGPPHRYRELFRRLRDWIK